MNQIEVVAAIFINKGKILCMQRGKGKYEYISFKYEFPGGKIDSGEEQRQALTREIKEEMDLEILPERFEFFMTINHQYPDFEIIMHSFLVKVDSPDFNRTEHISHSWVLPKDLKSLDWVQADLPIVEAIILKGDFGC